MFSAKWFWVNFVSARRMVSINIKLQIAKITKTVYWNIFCMTLIYHYWNLLNLNLLGQNQYLKKLCCMYHISQEEDSIEVTLVVKSVLLGEQFFVLDLVIILLPWIKVLVSLLAHLVWVQLFMLCSFGFDHFNWDINIVL